MIFAIALSTSFCCISTKHQLLTTKYSYKMAEELTLDTTLAKAEQYRQLLPQLVALTTGEPDLIANLANTVAALRQTFGFFWVGFYLVKGDELVLGPFQGPIACTRIRRGKGVCGGSWAQAQTLLVPDV